MKKSLEDLLQENYDSPNVSDECIDELVEFVKGTKSVFDEDVIFIKQLTKVAGHVIDLEDDYFTVKDLKKLYSFNDEGIRKIDSGFFTDLTENCLITMKSHFYAYKGDIAKVLFPLTKKSIGWGKKFHQSYKKSAEIAEKVDRSHARYAYSLAAEGARLLFERTRKHIWMQRAYEIQMKAGDMSVEEDIKHARGCYFYAGGYAFEMFTINPKRVWKNRAVAAYSKLTNLIPKNMRNSYDRTASSRLVFLDNTQCNS